MKQTRPLQVNKLSLSLFYDQVQLAGDRLFETLQGSQD
ncbi:MAG: hypothetical protein RLZZ617_571 [Bacteroidota bacterium]